MKTATRISIHGSYGRIFDLASRVEEWGAILPHYRYVKLLGREGNRKLVRMSARRDFIPVTWTAVQTVEPGSEERPGRIRFRHVKGLVRGMEVVWSFKVDREQGTVEVTITHDLERPPFPVSVLGDRLTELIVGKGFIGYIAGKTLRRIKELAEARVREPRQVVVTSDQ